MNEGRLFLYVSPNVLLPILFVVLMLTSLAVHASVLLNTTWFSDFFQGSAAVVAAPAEPVAAPVMEAAPAEAAAVEAEAAPAEAEAAAAE